jgi:hypothetical protein
MQAADDEGVSVAGFDRAACIALSKSELVPEVGEKKKGVDSSDSHAMSGTQFTARPITRQL